MPRCPARSYFTRSGGSAFGPGPRFLYRDQPGSPLGKLYEHGDVAAFLHNRPERPRVEIDRDVIPYNFGDWYGIDAFDGSTASMPLSVARISGAYWGRMLLSLRYSLGNKPAHEGEAKVFSSGSGVKVYENPDAFPRRWSVHKIAKLANDDEIIGGMAASKSGMRSEAFLTGAAPPVASCAGEDGVVLSARRLNGLTIDARMSCKGMVYRPASVILGAMMTLTGAMMSLYMLVRKP